MPELIDTHAHLDFPEFADDIPSVLDRARQAGVRTVITIGIDIPSSRRAVALADRYGPIHATAGIHPHDSFVPNASAMRELETIAAAERVVAVGEIGLDYYRNKKPRPVQVECMKSQIELACAIGKPAVFHIREAWEDFFRIVSDYADKLSGAVMHCFSGDWEIAKQCLEMGFYLSIPGVVTFSKAEVLQDVVRRAPLEKILIETDSPYLAPVPFRGKTNEPAFVFHTAKKIAELRAQPLEAIGGRTTRNARNVFGI